MPVYDNSNSVSGTATSSLTIPAFTVAGEDRGMFVGVGSASAAPKSTSTVVRNSSESFTELWDLNNGLYFHCSGHYFIAPAAGSYSVVVTLSGTDDEACAGAVSVTAADQVTGVGVAGTASSTATSTSTVTVAASDDELLVDMSFGWGATNTNGADQTPRWEQEGIAGSDSGGCSTQPGTADDVMSWTGYTNNQWVIGAVPIKPAAAASPPATPPPAMAAQQRMG